jgi:DUF4097 and DUF4098 domain-containing protein YvlB
MNSKVVWPVLLSGCLWSSLLFAEAKVEFHRTLSLAPSDHMILDVDVPRGDVTISYAHAGEISVSATAEGSAGAIPTDFFDRGLTVEREGEHIKVQFRSNGATVPENSRIAYTINVPNWIEVNSSVGTGKQAISGVMGPVKAVSGSGDVNVLYITNDLEAKTGHGDITVIRVGTAAKVETGSGSIDMKDIGPASSATVRKGVGKIAVDGISGSFTASTDAGDLRVAGGVYDNWELKSGSGSIYIEPGEDSSFEIDASTRSGRVSVENEDMEVPKDPNIRACHQKVNGGGKLVRARSTSGTIFIK